MIGGSEEDLADVTAPSRLLQPERTKAIEWSKQVTQIVDLTILKDWSNRFADTPAGHRGELSCFWADIDLIFAHPASIYSPLNG